MTSFGVGRNNPILKLEIPTDKLPCLLIFARGSWDLTIGICPFTWRIWALTSLDFHGKELS
jgi:hypothetical protein